MISAAAIDRFQAAPWLAEMDSAARSALLNVLTESRAEAEAVLLEQGQPNDHLAFIIEGAATVFRADDAGRRETLTVLEAPSIFGLTSFFSPTPPGFTVRSDTPVWLLTLDHDAHDLLRRIDLRASEQLALAAVRILTERFKMLDQKLTEDLAEHPEDHPKLTEWAKFRARLFEESNI